MSGPGSKRIKKSRYDSIDSFISNNKYFRKEYNDIPLEIDGETFTELEKAGIPHLLANHIAHLFIRDPLVIYKERVEIDDSKDVDHFENIQSTNFGKAYGGSHLHLPRKTRQILDGGWNSDRPKFS